MSFLVASNGQFSPHPIERTSVGIHPVEGIRPLPAVAEFKEILQQMDEQLPFQPHSQIKLYQQQAQSFKRQKKSDHAKDIMTSPVRVISESADATEAKQMLEKFGFRHLPVVNSSNLIVGMISDRELLGVINHTQCREIMIAKVIVCDDLTSIHEIAITLLNQRINALPIINRKHELTGIITLTDILNYVIKATSFLTTG